MPKIQRKTQKVFCNSADSDQLAVFGSMSTGTPVYSSDVEELQSNEAFDLGWDAATLEDKAPFMEEMNGVQYGLTYQIAYGLQEGIPEYDSATTYYIGSICKVLEDGKPILYTSLTDDNIGNDPVNDSTNWERLSFGGGGLEIGDIGFTQMAINESKGKRRILNGQLIIQDQYVQFTNIIKATLALNPDLACTEAEWQTALTMSANGVCEKFVIDDEAGTIRLPKYPEYLDLSINGAKSVSVYGTGYAMGLQTKSGVRYMAGQSASAEPVLRRSSSSGKVGAQLGAVSNTEDQNLLIGLAQNPSQTGIVGSVTTSSEQIKGTYFIQVATGAETEDNITNTIELNNPFSLLDYKYSEYELSNLSWLRSEGQYNSKAIYPAVYDLLLKIYNGTETKAGVSVKLTTETFTDYDFVLNTADETFRLPTKVKLASGKAVVGNGKAIGLTNNEGLINTAYNNTYWGFVGHSPDAYDKNTGVTVNPTTSMSGYLTMGLSTDPTKSGIETSDSDLYLYFYVGETVQNANLVNIGRIQETYTTKSMVDGQWVKGYSSLLSNYTIPANATSDTQVDLSNYLPNDGYDYEVIIEINGATGTTNGNQAYILVGSDKLERIPVCSARTFAASTAAPFSGNINILVGAGRYIVVRQGIVSNACTLSCRAHAYRRLGTNL